LSIALLNGQTPVFFRPPSEPVIPYPDKLLTKDNKMSSQDHVIPEVDQDLATAWRVMRRFCLLVNLGTQTHRMIYPDFIHETMIAVMYRLLHIEYPPGSIDETVRMGLLAFCHHVFLQWQDIKLPGYPFPSTYRDCVLESCRRQQRRHGPPELVDPQLMLWLLVTGAISLFDLHEEVWLSECLREYVVDRCHVKTWKDMQEILKSFMWVALLDDRPGKQIYDHLFFQIEK
jgi:hypothetical protein